MMSGRSRTCETSWSASVVWPVRSPPATPWSRRQNEAQRLVGTVAVGRCRLLGRGGATVESVEAGHRAATPTPPQNSAAPPASSSTRPPHPWEINARAWLDFFPDGRAPTEPEVDAYIDAHRPELPSLPCSRLQQRILAFRGDQVLDAEQSAFPYKFQRTDLWKPVYQWLESLEMDSLVETKQISDWLTSNPKIMDRLVEKHSKYHLIHYTQRMHLKLLKKRGKLPKSC